MQKELYKDSYLTASVDKYKGIQLEFRDSSLLNAADSISVYYEAVLDGAPEDESAVMRTRSGDEFTFELLDEFDVDRGILSFVLITTTFRTAYKDIKDAFKASGTPVHGNALYASRIELSHPVTGEPVLLKSEPENDAFDAIELDEEL